MIKPKITRNKIQIQTVNGLVEATVWRSDRSPEGLYALNVEQVLPEKPPAQAPNWDVVTHQGFTVAVAFASRAEALEATEWLEGIADWSLSAEFFVLGDVHRGVVEALVEFGHGGVA